MKKKLIALAVAGATLAPLAAMAQTSNPVTLYGRAYATFESVKADGGNLTPLGTRSRVTDQSSFFGIRGTEDLGGGVKAFFQLETQFRLDSNNTTFANRNSAVGLQGDFGSVLLGRWDSPMKVVTGPVDPFGDLTIGGYTAVAMDRGNFDRREQNVVQYWSPNLSGFQARGSFVTNEGKTNASTNTQIVFVGPQLTPTLRVTPVPAVNPSSLSFSATYTQGPFYVGYAWEKHKNQWKAYTAENGVAPAVAGANEKGQALFGTFTIGPLKLGVMTQFFLKENPNIATAGPNKLATGLGKNGSTAQLYSGVYTIGNNQILLSHQRSKDGTYDALVDGRRPEDAKAYITSIGYQYNFTRRTFVLGQYAVVKNNTRGQGDIAGDRLGVGADQDPKGLSVGIRHLF